MPHRQEKDPATLARNQAFNQLYLELTDQKGVLYPLFDVSHALRVLELALENETSLTDHDLPLLAMFVARIRTDTDVLLERVADYIFKVQQAGAGEGLSA